MVMPRRKFYFSDERRKGFSFLVEQKRNRLVTVFMCKSVSVLTGVDQHSIFILIINSVLIRERHISLGYLVIVDKVHFKDVSCIEFQDLIEIPKILNRNTTEQKLKRPSRLSRF